MLSQNSMGTETKVNCYARNTDRDITRVQKVSRNSAAENSAASRLQNGQQDSVVATLPPRSHVSFVPIEVDENDVFGGAKEIIKSIRPHWNLNFVEYKKFTDGITNKLVGCFYNPPRTCEITSIAAGVNSMEINATDQHSSTLGIRNQERQEDSNDSGNLSDVDAEADNEANAATSPSNSGEVVLVRVYGNKTDLLIDRKAETRNIMLLHSYGFAPTLYATFKNGLVYDFVPGVTLNTQSVLRPEVWSLVAKRLANMHRLVKTDGDTAAARNVVPMLWKKTQSFFDLVPEQYSDASKHKRLLGTFLPIGRLRKEFAELYGRLEALNSPIVFTHNDLLLGNVVYTESRNTVTFIDYEYADYNFQAFDIGNHFAEFAGVDTVDYSLYPNRDFQFKWLRVYLQTYLQKDDVSDIEVNRLYVQVNQFALAAHFFWAVWSLIQAEHSTIDFDYVEYAFIRYNEYLAKKEKFLSLLASDGGDGHSSNGVAL